MTDTIVVAERFQGFPDSAQGGYVAGLLARLAGADLEVTFRRRVPLEEPLTLERRERGPRLLGEGLVLAEAKPARPDPSVPDGVTFAEAVAASRRPVSSRHHPSPHCFCCGTERAEGDGMRIHPGRVSGRDVAAAPWIPGPDLADGGGRVGTEFVWSALDCPGFWGMALSLTEPIHVVTVRLSVSVRAAIRAGEPCVVMGWPIARRRRWFECGSAVLGADGDPRAVAHATWLQVPEDR